MKLFKLDFLSIVTIAMLFIYALIINRLIDVYSNTSTMDETITAWISAISGTLVSITLVIQLRNKRKKEEEQQKS